MFLFLTKKGHLESILTQKDPFKNEWLIAFTFIHSKAPIPSVTYVVQLLQGDWTVTV